MAKQGTKTTVPRLRFPDFRNALPWNEKLLEDICTVNPSNDGLPNSFVYIDLESVEDGQLKAKNRIEKSDAPSRAQRHLCNGDVIFQVVRPYQRNNLFVDFDDGQQYVASTGYAQLRAKDSERFLYQAVHVDSFVKGVIAKCTGSNYPAINSSDLAEIRLFAPHDAAEQQKIADCLTSLDEMIAAQGRKVEALKAHKRGLMQQLFPREGETRPRLRFPEFRKAPEWETSPLGLLIQVASGQVDPTESPYCDWPHVGGDNIEPETGNLAGLRSAREDGVTSGKYLFDERDVLYSKIRPVLNKVAVPALRGICSADIYPIRPANSDITREFLAYLLRSVSFVEYATKNSERGKIPKINREALAAYSAPLPKPSEQQRIADCLASLDTRITAESNQLAALKTHKHGLMQQLFPSQNVA